MPANSSFDLVSLDFDALKGSLISWLQTQTQFKDFDFTGSNLNVLMDLLSYNTTKNAFYLNMALSEGFLDSAQLLPSVLSHAKELNYLPRSARSAKATVQVDFSATTDNAPYVVPKGQSFTALVKNKSFLFSIPETIIVASPNTSFSFTTDIYQGQYVKESFIFDTTSLVPQRFKLTNPNIDTDSIVVNVFENQLIADIYRRAISLLDLDGTSKVYFVQTNPVDGNYEILFGDGIVGYQPKNGSTVVVDYRLSDGDVANGAGRFAINFDPTAPFGEMTSNIRVTTITAATGGAPIEDIETTRFYAPRWFQTQERAIVPMDYEVLLKTQFPEIHAINVYGGETLSPPQFGKVVVALVISNVLGLPQTKLQQYYDFLKKRCPITVQPIFTLPQYLWIKVFSTIRYNVNVTNETENRMQSVVSQAIADYNNTFLNDFNVTFRFSKFCEAIDNSDSSIVSDVTQIFVYKEFAPFTNMSQSGLLKFGFAFNNLFPPTPQSHARTLDRCFYTSGFVYNGHPSLMEDDGQGNVRIMQIINDQYTFVKNVGTIDYTNGTIRFDNVIFDSYDGPAICFYVWPLDYDVTCAFNTILAIKPDKVELTIQQLQQ